MLSVLGLSVPAQSFFQNSVRFASKKAGGSSKNLGGKSPGKRYGIKKQDGKQFYKLLSLFSLIVVL